MKLISDFHDFYDSAIHYSDFPVWIRKSRKFFIDKTRRDVLTLDDCNYLYKLFEKVPTLNIIDKTYRFGNYKYFAILSIACKLFLIFRSLDNKPFIDINEFKTYLKNRYDVDFYDGRFFGDILPFTEEGVKAWYKEAENYESLLNVHLHIESPVFIIESGGLYCEEDKRYYYNRPYLFINPRLLDYNLQKILHPWEIYQEMEMFLSNQLVDLKEVTTEFSDDLKRHYHGMDEWSFKQKGPKKRKRR